MRVLLAMVVAPRASADVRLWEPKDPVPDGWHVALWLPWNLHAKGMSTVEVGRVLTGVLSIVSSLVHAIGWVGVVVAIFGWRRQQPA